MKFTTPIYLALAAMFLAYAIIQPEWGSAQHWLLVVFAGCTSSGIYGLISLSEKRGGRK